MAQLFDRLVDTKLVNSSGSGRQRYNFATSRVVLGDDEVECAENICEMRPRERHGLDAAEVKGSVGTNQKYTGLGKQGRLFNSSRGEAEACRDVEASRAGYLKIKAITQSQGWQSPFLLAALGTLGSIR